MYGFMDVVCIGEDTSLLSPYTRLASPLLTRLTPCPSFSFIILTPPLETVSGLSWGRPLWLCLLSLQT